MLPRSYARNTVHVGKTVFGAEKLVECVPVVATSRESLMNDLKKICALNPDLIEWRIDYYCDLENDAFLTDTLDEMLTITKDIPVLLTFRALSEGGYTEYPDALRLKVITTLVKTGHIDAVDTELSAEPSFVAAVRSLCKENGVKLILSWHNINETPSVDELVGYLVEEEAAGADIAKVSVQPNSFTDVIKLLTAAKIARGKLNIPQITVSKDDIGVITRIFGQYLGSDLTFFSVAGSSTIGQVSLEDYRELCKLLEL